LTSPSFAFCSKSSTPTSPRFRVDRDTWTRARGWALVLAAAYLANAGANDRFASVAAATIDEAILA
jgi:aminoglycoside phosphotransferase (APT) family kinase protein